VLRYRIDSLSGATTITNSSIRHRMPRSLNIGNMPPPDSANTYVKLWTEGTVTFWRQSDDQVKLCFDGTSDCKPRQKDERIRPSGNSIATTMVKNKKYQRSHKHYASKARMA